MRRELSSLNTRVSIQDWFLYTWRGIGWTHTVETLDNWVRRAWWRYPCQVRESEVGEGGEDICFMSLWWGWFLQANPTLSIGHKSQLCVHIFQQPGLWIPLGNSSLQLKYGNQGERALLHVSVYSWQGLEVEMARNPPKRRLSVYARLEPVQMLIGFAENWERHSCNTKKCADLEGRGCFWW